MLNKKLTFAVICAGLAAIGVSTQALAAVPGFYVGGQIGYSDAHYNTNDFAGFGNAHINSNGVGYRIYIGYDWNCNWGAETGYMTYADTKYSAVTTVFGPFPDFKVRQSAWDLLGKVMLPFDYGFALFGKAGLAYVNQRISSTNNNIGNFVNGVNKWRPVISLGGSYDFNPNVQVDLSYTRMFSGSGIPNSDFGAAGISYHFG